MPADFLIAALHATDNGRPVSDEVSLATAHLERLLQRPVAENHLHVGAAFGFPLLWTTWMGAWIRDMPPLKSLRIEPGSPLGNATSFRDRLLAAAFTRILLASFLWRRERDRMHGTFSDFETRELPGMAERLSWPWGARDALRWMSRALALLRGVETENDFPRMQRLYALLIAPAPFSAPDTLQALRDADPLASWLKSSAAGPCAETLFAVRALHYLLHEGQDDSRFAEHFWQYERVRGLVHAHLIQEPGTAGLDWFGRHYRRLSPLRGPLEDLRFHAALAHQGREVRLSALETRTAPLPSWTEVRDELRRLARAGLESPSRPEGSTAPELGMVFHFIKEREHRLGGATRLHIDPAGDPSGFRFGVWSRKRRGEAQALEAALRYHPELLLLARGLDVASTELAVPTWAVAPNIRRVRDTSVTIASALMRQQPTWRSHPMRVACHAGEEFTRLVEGLRRIHELKEAGLLHNGDRIGHGLALGVGPEAWARTSRVVIQPAEDRLDDLLWELDRYCAGDVPASASRLERVRSEAVSLLRGIYAVGAVDLELFRTARRLRHDPTVLERLGFPDRPKVAPAPGSPEALVLCYLRDVGVFRRGQALVEVRSDPEELVFLDAVQHWLRSLLARLEITVESNPSSNLLIADMLGIEEHPVLRMAGSRLGDLRSSTLSDVMVSLSSDDPITFATRLADEYAYFYFALLRKLVPSAQALEWLDLLRENGMRSRFTLPASAVHEALRSLVPDFTASPSDTPPFGRSPRRLKAEP
ncbi:hypothetical protein NR800_22305 [Corallococcus interemptor]|uniref:hypothetical protein n=1 Tax=Corallococcus interemptor TaxID=2316720 RepID=UPI0035D4C9AB